jgi:hypothetical protein
MDRRLNWIQSWPGCGCKEKIPHRRPSIDGRIILKQVLKKSGVKMWTVFMGLRTGSGGGLL